MKIKGKHLFLTALILLLAVPSRAVFDEKDLGQTLSELRFELSQEIDSRPSRSTSAKDRNQKQRDEMMKLIKKCNELSLMLYSQKQDCTFDLTYALKKVTAEYEEYNYNRKPYEELVFWADLEINRYARLIESLRRLPPQLHDIDDLPDSLAYRNDSLQQAELKRRSLISEEIASKRFVVDSMNANGHRSAFFLDEKGMEDRDSCVSYATTLLKQYSSFKDAILADKDHYEEARLRIEESYDYAQERYKNLQKKMFAQAQSDYIAEVILIYKDGKVQWNFGNYWRRAIDEARRKYARRMEVDDDYSESNWSGPVIVKFLTSILGCFLIGLTLSFLIILLISLFFPKLKTNYFKSARPGLCLLLGVVIFIICLICIIARKQGSFISMASGLLLTYCWLAIAILASILLRLRGNSIVAALRLYAPLAVLGLLVIVFRIVFISDRMMNLFLPPILLLAFNWMLVACIRQRKKAGKSDNVMGVLTVLILAVTTVLAWSGFVFLSILIIIWWLFQVSAVESVIAIKDLVEYYEHRWLKKKVAAYISQHGETGLKGVKRLKGEFFSVTWPDDLVNMVVIPVIAVLSLPYSIWLALDVFDFTEAYQTYLATPFFNLSDANGQEILHISFNKIVLAVCFFFDFRFISYAAKAIFRNTKIRRYLKANKVSYMHINDVNFTLGNNVIGIVVWFIYAVMVIALLKIPVGAISMVATGLAAGIGLALKDVINNIICSIQLMSGRLRVGDWVDVNGVRGKVENISYQSTQIETIDGAVMSFLNSDLFSRNFRNLTRNDRYELLKFVVGVAYGTDVDKVRKVIMDAVTSLQGKDGYGRDIIDMSRGVNVVFNEFGASSVDVAVKQYVLVSQRYVFEARAKEFIYNAFKENGIEIPFPQTDIHIKND